MHCESTAYLYLPLKINAMTFDLDNCAPGKPLSLELKKADLDPDNFVAKHTGNARQINGFRVGSAFNLHNHKQ